MLTRLIRFARAREGLAAVEFALIAPVMLVMFFGMVEMTSAIDCNTRVGRVSSTVADLVAQSTAVSTTDVSNIFAAANSILYPFDSSGAKIVVSSLVDDGKGATTVAWSQAQNTTARSKGETVTVPSGLVVKGSGSSVIYTEIAYTYTSSVAYFLPNGITLKSNFYTKPRRSTTVTHS